MISESNGMDFLRKLKKEQSNIPPFIFMSGFSEISKEEALSNGANDFVRKPIKFVDLIKIIENHGQNAT